MDAAAVMEVIDLVGALLDHIPYAVCGTAALIYYGYRGYRPDHVSITCPEESKEAIRCWALAKGCMSNDPDGFRVRTADRRSWDVRVKFMKSGFQNLLRIRVGPSKASIVTLPSIANTIARSYVARLHAASTERQAVYARYLTWTLRRIIVMYDRCPDQRLCPHRARDIVSREFWIPFTLSFPDTVPLFTMAGLELIDGYPRQWQVEDLLISSPYRSFHSQDYKLWPGDDDNHETYDDDDEDAENGLPSLRRVTRRLPDTRPLLTPLGFSSPSTSSSSSPTSVLTSSTAAGGSASPTQPRYHHFQQRSSSETQGSARRRIHGMTPQVWI